MIHTVSNNKFYQNFVQKKQKLRYVVLENMYIEYFISFCTR